MKKTIRDLDIKGKRVLVRVDFNVPLDEKLQITDDTRIRASIPTLQYALDQGAKRLVLMSHLGRPKAKPEAEFSLRPAAERLSRLLKRPVVQCSDCVGDKAASEVRQAPPDAVILLENLRFHGEEEKNDEAFAKQLASHGDVYVNDAFGTSHRAHASVAAITKLLPSVAGFLLEKEIQYLGDAMRKPAKPFVVILGGAKVSDKIGLVNNLIDKVDGIIIGGAMAYTFLKAQGVEVAKSRVETEKLDTAKDILAKAKAKGVIIHLPEDHVVADEFKADAKTRIEAGGITGAGMGLDIGPKTAKKFAEILSKAHTAVWNGPMGVFEMPAFRAGSKAVGDALAPSIASIAENCLILTYKYTYPYTVMINY